MSTPALSTKRFAFDVKADDLHDDGTFDVYAAVFGNVDRANEIIVPGAFANIPDFVKDGVVLFEHRQDLPPIGFVESAEQDGKGLRVKGRFHKTADVAELRQKFRERVEAGKSVKCSVGYRVLDWDLIQVDGRKVTRLKRLLVFEFSFVNVPCNPEAEAVSVKGLADPPTEAPMTEPRPSPIEVFKSWLGLSTKAGRKMSRSNFAELKGFATTLSEHAKQASAHADELADHAKRLTAKSKDMRTHGEGMKAFADGLHKHLSQFDPDAEDVDEPEAEAQDAGDDDKSSPELIRKRLQLGMAKAPKPGA